MNRKTESFGLPEYHLVELAQLIVDSIPMPISRYRSQNMCRLFKPILVRMTTMVRGMELAGPPKCHLAEWSTNRGCFLELDLLWEVTTNEWIVSNLVKNDQGRFDRDSTPSASNHRSKVHLTSLPQEWSSSVECEFSVFFLFSTWDLELGIFRKIGAKKLLKLDDSRQRV